MLSEALRTPPPHPTTLLHRFYLLAPFLLHLLLQAVPHQHPLLPQVALALCISVSELSGQCAATMFSWLKRGGARGQQPEAIRTVTSALKELYREKLLPLEEH